MKLQSSLKHSVRILAVFKIIVTEILEFNLKIVKNISVNQIMSVQVMPCHKVPGLDKSCKFRVGKIGFPD